MNKQLLCLAQATFAACFAMSAGEAGSGGDDGQRRAGQEALTWSAPADAPGHGKPNVHLITADNKFHFGAGGAVKATVSFDWGSPIDCDYAFATSEIDVDPAPGNSAKWQSGARDSYLYFNAVALPGDKNQVGAYVNFNFHGNNYAPKLQYAYLRWRGITAGYAYSLFADQTAVVPTIDYQSANSYTAVQAPAVNYEHTFGQRKKFKIGAGLSQSVTSITDGNSARKVSQRLPDIPAYVQYSYGAGSHIRLSVVLRDLYYRNLATGKNRSDIGWGVKLSGVTSVADRLTAYYQLLAGKGISSYFQDLTGAGLDMAYSSEPGKLNPTESWGGYIGLQYDITRRLHIIGTYSHIRLYPGEGEELPDTQATYRYAQYAAGTITYDITGYLSCGMEYVYGRRVQLDGAQRHNNRVQTCLQVKF